ncbi:uncharacterized protein [Dermacentor albipictus]|uniref:uncharacterized protein isoform X2 n=1 Tax=Dermacentor albipictus TaxID=60249 RepID=UPI0031FE340C
MPGRLPTEAGDKRGALPRTRTIGKCRRDKRAVAGVTPHARTLRRALRCGGGWLTIHLILEHGFCVKYRQRSYWNRCADRRSLSPVKAHCRVHTQRRIRSVMDGKDGLNNNNKPHCADKECNKPLSDKPGPFRPCPECRKITCVACNAQHEGKSCDDHKTNMYKQSKKLWARNVTGDHVSGDPSRDSHAGDFETDHGLAQACGGESFAAGQEDLAEEDYSVVFNPGDEYCCGVDGCLFTVSLLEGSTKFWCPWCHCRHRIEGGKLVKVSRPPSHVNRKIPGEMREKRTHIGVNF